ncbi:hypothetical protein TRVL_04057 [Trypanosoma vivax]|nr:hypothetical protein TRVL_04057 [Trypanosoma vivax]
MPGRSLVDFSVPFHVSAIPVAPQSDVVFSRVPFPTPLSSSWCIDIQLHGFKHLRNVPSSRYGHGQFMKQGHQLDFKRQCSRKWPLLASVSQLSQCTNVVAFITIAFCWGFYFTPHTSRPEVTQTTWC